MFQPHERKCHTNRHLARRERLSHGTSTTGGSRAGLFIAHSRAAYLYWYLETAASGWQFTRAAGAESNRLRDAPSRVTTQMVRPDDLREAHVSLQRSASAPPHRRRRWGHDGYRCVRRKAPAAPGPDAHAPQRMAKCPPRLRRPSEQPVPRSLSRPIAEPSRDNLCAS